jgi:hypothetical protein
MMDDLQYDGVQRRPVPKPLKACSSLVYHKNIHSKCDESKKLRGGKERPTLFGWSSFLFFPCVGNG